MVDLPRIGCGQHRAQGCSLAAVRISCYTNIAMTQEIHVTKKSRGRPRGATKEPTAIVRIPESVVVSVDEWIARQPEPKPSRPDAVGLLIKRGLG
jgi:hypothetical protein